jgi:hypothetical protein
MSRDRQAEVVVPLESGPIPRQAQQGKQLGLRRGTALQDHQQTHRDGASAPAD